MQLTHGGSTRALPPPPGALEAGRRVLDAVAERFGSPLLYARVDLIRGEEGLLLVELEVTEPLLFLGYEPSAPARFADAIASTLATPAHPERRAREASPESKGP